MNRILSIFALTTIIYLSSCAPSAQEAAAYNEKIVTIHKSVNASMDTLIVCLNSYDTVLISKQIESSKVNLGMSKSDISKVGSFGGDDILFKPTNVLINSYLELIGNEFIQIYKLYCIPDTAFTETHKKEAEKLNKNIEKEMKIPLDALKKAQAEFVEKYKLSFETDSVPAK